MIGPKRTKPVPLSSIPHKQQNIEGKKFFTLLPAIERTKAILFLVFFAFVSHWGITTFGARMMERKAMLEANKIEAAGEETAGTISAIRKIGDAFKGSPS